MNARMFLMAAVAAVVLVGIAMPTLEAAPKSATYSPILILPTPPNAAPGFPSNAGFINNRGQVTVGWIDESYQSQAGLWDHDVIIPLIPGAQFSFAYAINDRGEVIGNTDCWCGFIWRNGVATYLGVLVEGVFSEPTAINNHGQVVGWSDTVSGYDAFLWHNGSMIDLGTLGGNFSRAVAINDRGQVVGWSTTVPDGSEERPHAILWQDGVMTDLGTLGGDSSYAVAINDRGQVVGASTTASGDWRAFLWEQGVMIDLGTLYGGSSYAASINVRGQVVGVSISSDSDAQHGFIWQDGIMTDIGVRGARDVAIIAINRRGQVIGNSCQVCSIPDVKWFLWEDGVVTDLSFPAKDINDRGLITGGDAVWSRSNIHTQ